MLRLDSVSVCMCERERERKRGSESERERDGWVWVHTDDDYSNEIMIGLSILTVSLWLTSPELFLSCVTLKLSRCLVFHLRVSFPLHIGPYFAWCLSIQIISMSFVLNRWLTHQVSTMHEIWAMHKGASKKPCMGCPLVTFITRPQYRNVDCCVLVQ